MNPAILKTATQIGKVISSNGTTILTGLAVGGFGTTIFMTIKGDRSANRKIEQEKNLRYEKLPKGKRNERIEPLTTKELVELTWQDYAPAAVMGVATVACMVAANHVGLRRNAALASAYSLTETALREYQQKVVEVIGEKKEQQVRDDIAQDKLAANPVSGNTIFITDKGESLVYETISGRYFKSDIESIRQTQNDLNQLVLKGEDVTLNMMFGALGLDYVDLGKSIGWAVGWSNDRPLLEFVFSSKLTDKNEPCLVLSYRYAPRQL
jgi:hypothetical protein